MSLRAKTLLIVSLTLAALVGTLSVGIRALLLRRLLAYEGQDGRERAAALQRSLQMELAELGATTEDYAYWDETYAFMQGGNPGFVETQLPDARSALRIEVMALADTSGRLVFGQGLELERRSVSELPEGVAAAMAGALRFAAEGGEANGLLDLPQGPLLVAARPILRANRQGPPQGMLLLGRWLGGRMLASLTRRLPPGHSLHVYRFGDPATLGQARQAARLLSPTAPTAALALDPERLAAYARLDDLGGGPGVILALEMPRVILSQGRASVGYLVSALLFTGLVFGALVVGLLEKLVLSRVSRLSADVGRIAEHADGDAQVSLQGGDELSALGGAVNGMLEAIRSSRRRLEASEIQAQRMEAVGRLAGGVAHDFNNLLNVILGHSELALRKLGEGDPVRRNLAEVIKAAERAATLTSQLLAFGRRQVLEPRLLDLNQVVAESAPMLSRLVGEQVELVTRTGRLAGRVKADPSQVQRALLSLASNARDAMPKGGRLVIATRDASLEEREEAGLAPGAYTALVVSDSGAGMDAETRRRAFEPFFTTKEQGQGTGLGLASVYGIAQQSGGAMNVVSEVGRDSVFTILLPTEADIAQAPSFPATNGGAGSGEAAKATILLVEDQPELRALFGEVLESSGYRVVSAENAAEARTRWSENVGQIDLLVTDVVMPGGGGPALAEELLARAAGLKVLFMSGYPDQAYATPGALGRGVPFLQKPFTSEALLASVGQVLAGS
jgi:signal transduction histidine kinase